MAVTDEAILRIKQMIMDGELKPGDRLPAEKELSERLGLSRNSMREAVKALELVRVLDVRQGDGTYVTTLRPELLMESMAFAVDLSQHESILELLEVRRILDPTAAAMAAGRATDEQIEGMWTTIAGLDEHTSVEGLVEKDLELHRAIAKAASNSYLASLMASVSAQTFRTRLWHGLSEDGVVPRTLAEQAAIVSAIAAHDTQLARAVTLAHVVGVEAWLKKQLARPDVRRSDSVEW